MSEITEQPTDIHCADGHRLSGHWFLPENTPEVAVALHPATGVDMTLYRKFGRYLAEQGWAALIYDFRGTAASAKPGDERRRDIRMSDWILFDVPAATAAVKARFPDAHHVAIGHSVGAHGMLATQAAEPVAAMVMVASHAGVTRLISTAAERAKVWTIFNIVTPLTARLMGYVPVEKLGVGKQIPLGVMTQWARWSRQGGYFFDDTEFDLRQRFRRARGPVLSVVLTDDLWANRRAVDVLTDELEAADVEKLDIEAGQNTAVGPVGHMGFYRSAQAQLWPDIVAWVRRELRLPAQ